MADERDRIALCFEPGEIGFEGLADSVKSIVTRLSERRFIELPQKAQDLVRPIEASPVDLVLPQELRDAMQEVIEEYKAEMELRIHRVPLRRKLLFHGPPGNGKTTAAGWLCRSVNMNGYAVSIPDVVESYLGNTSRNLQRLFEAVNVGVGLVLDEIDAIGTSRGVDDVSGSGREYNAIVCSLLSLMDRQERGVLIATTNRVDHLDPALRRRFDLELEFPPPTVSQSEQLCKTLCVYHGVPEEVHYGPSFDAITKAVRSSVRRQAIAAWRQNNASVQETGS